MISISCFNVQWESNAPNAQLPTSLIGAVVTSCLPHYLAQRPTLVFRRSCGRSKTAFPLRAALPKPSEFVLSKLQPGPKLHSSLYKLAANSKTHLLAFDGERYRTEPCPDCGGIEHDDDDHTGELGRKGGSSVGDVEPALEERAEVGEP